MDDQAKQSPNRLVLVRSVKLLVLIGVGFATVPFFGFFLSGPNEQDSGTSPGGLVVTLGELEPGEIKKVDWLGRPVWIYYRTSEDIQAIQGLKHQLGDPESQSSEQPEEAGNPLRSLRDDYFVFVPLETSRNCHVHYVGPDEFGTEERDWYGGFLESCHRARFDLAGRIYKNYGNSRQRNLNVPPHRFLSQQKLSLGANQLND